MALYLLSVCYPADSTRPPAAELERIISDVTAVGVEQKQRGTWVFGGGLADPSSATTVLSDNGDVVLTDGPFIESKEQIGGFSIIEARDLDEAIEWARLTSAATRTPIEVRPFLPGAADRSTTFDN